MGGVCSSLAEEPLRYSSSPWGAVVSSAIVCCTIDVVFNNEIGFVVYGQSNSAALLSY